MKQFSIAVIIPCRNEIRYIEKLLNCILMQVEVPNDMEIIVADGRSDDGTRVVLNKIANRNTKIKIVDNPDLTVSYGLNAAILSTHADIIIRMDAHTEYSSNYVSACIQTLLETGADNVGGPARTRSTGYFQAANSVAFHSRFSVGGSSFHDDAYEGWTDTVTYGCWWRDKLVHLGLFDTDFVRNQDDELNLRIIRSGGRIWQSPKILSWYYPRSSFLSLFRQYFQYGYWKVKVIQKHRIPASFRHIIPATLIFVFFVTFIGSFASYNLYILMLTLIFIYVSINFLVSVVCCIGSNKIKYLPILPVVFSCYHFGYGFGFLRGLFDLLRGAFGKQGRFTDITR